MVMLRANCSVMVMSQRPGMSGSGVAVPVPGVGGVTMPELSRIVTVPESVPQNTTSVADSSGPALFSTGASGAPPQTALPTAPVNDGECRVARALQGELDLLAGA